MTAIQELKPPRGASTKGPELNKKILVVDDESAILQTLRFNLERSGYAVVTAGDGRTAIAMAQREQPDLIVLDIMPVSYTHLVILHQDAKQSELFGRESNPFASNR